MGTSFVDFKDYGYWTKDGFLEGLSFMLAREFEKILDKGDWQKELIERWKEAATAGFIGCVPSYIDDYFDSSDRLEILQTTLKKIIEELETNNNFITIEVLNNNKVGMGGWQEVNSQGFKKTAQLMLDLICGKLKTNASSPIDYWDFGNDQ